MKKKLIVYIFLFLLIFLSLNNIYADTNALYEVNDYLVIKVSGEVKTKSYVPVVYYDEEILLNDLVVLNDNEEKFNISVPGRTKLFRIIIEGNQTESRNLEVKIQGQKFVGVQGTRTENVDTLLYVNALDPNLPNNINPNNNIPFISLLNISKGLHSLKENIVEVSFVLAWNGNDSLPAGNYTSDVDIEYSVVD